MILKDIISGLHEWAPPGIAQSYDNVGLQVGDPEQDVSHGLIALEVTPDVIREAEDLGVDLIVTHHPLLFKPLRQLSPATLVGSMTLRLARAGISLVAAHTNLDSVQDGVSNTLADLLDLQNKEVLSPISEGMLKLVVFVPADHVDAVRTALHETGAGQIGCYSHVGFQSEGTGIFKPLAGSNPFIGTPCGPVREVPEWRIEVPATRDRLPALIDALLDAHPYETPVYDVYEMADTTSGFGLGMIGDLERPETLADFLSRVCRRLDTPAVRYAGDPTSEVRRVAVCGGAGRDLVSTAMRRGAHVYVTSDVGYHTFFDVMDAEGGVRMALVDAGHYETEAATEGLLKEWLSRNAAQVRWTRTSVRTSPISTFITP